ncbi:hypothetical protein RclHR1_22400001 [Rhizophagus clarus]|uniref:Uncharacterized protein n=1 Tax=Rhizophagus clarus TaxID=94130 RepID=A0A2Z6QWD1_9GLOM|nr:hypothetical protein RclHR1_22400001 [Rhizophagus clarus]
MYFMCCEQRHATPISYAATISNCDFGIDHMTYRSDLLIDIKALKKNIYFFINSKKFFFFRDGLDSDFSIEFWNETAPKLKELRLQWIFENRKN